MKYSIAIVLVFASLASAQLPDLSRMLQVDSDKVTFNCPITRNSLEVRRSGENGASVDWRLAATGTNFHIGRDGIRITDRNGQTHELNASTADLGSIAATIRSALGGIIGGNPLAGLGGRLGVSGSGSNGADLGRRGQIGGSINIGGQQGARESLGLGGRGGQQGSLNLEGLRGQLAQLRGNGEGNGNIGLGQLGQGWRAQLGQGQGGLGGLSLPGLGGRGGAGGFGLSGIPGLSIFG